MTETAWLPGVVTLALGLAAGLAGALMLWRRHPHDRARHLELVVGDLEARRDELYSRLRDSSAEEASGAERHALELAAARFLRDLDASRAELSRVRSKRPAARGTRGTGRARASRPQPSGRHPALAGFGFGAGTVALVAILVYWALGDARPDPMRGATQPPPTATTPGEEGVEGPAGLPPETAQRLAELERRLEADPQDLEARREMAHLLLGVGDLFEAFQHASALTRSSPDDPDGLYVQAVVRVAMGQDEVALDLLQHTLHVDPGYVGAHLLKGLILLELRDRQAAINVWERGLTAVGGQEPNLEHALALARAGYGFDEIVGTRPGDPAAGSAPEDTGADR